MRITGYILLLAGFLWLVIQCAGSMDALNDSISQEHSRKFPDLAKYSGDEVRRAIVSAVNDYRNHLPGITIPAALMLVGGILLDIAGWRAARKNALEKISFEGEVELLYNKLTVRIPLAAGGGKLAALAKGIGEVDRDYLYVTIDPKLAAKSQIRVGSLVTVNNRKGRLNIERSAADTQSR